MTTAREDEFVPDRIEAALRDGASAASESLGRWLGRPARVEVCRSRSASLDEAVQSIGPSDLLVHACAIPLTGAVPATVLLIVDDQAGPKIAGVLLGKDRGPSADWDDEARSAIEETANIVACAYVGAVARSLGSEAPLVPGPPELHREFAGCLVEFAMMDQAARSDRVLLVETKFSIGEDAQDWHLLIVPTAEGALTLGTDEGGDS